jgi:hypothetical protein
METEISKKYVDFVNEYKYLKNNEESGYSIDRKKAIITFLTKLEQEIGNDKFFDYHFVIDYFENKYKNKETLKKNLGMLSAYIRYTFNNNMYSQYITNLANELMNKIKPQIEDIDLNLIDKTEISDMDRLILKIYTQTNCLRNDYCSLKIKNFNEEEDNYYKDGKFVFNTLKKNNRKLTVNVEHLKELIEKLIEQNKQCDYLFHNKQYKQYSEKYFSNYIISLSEKVFNQKLGINYYRKRCSTNAIQNKSESEKVEITKNLSIQMNNSPNTQQCYYQVGFIKKDMSTQTD